MSKQQIIEQDGIVEEALPSGRFKVRLNNGVLIQAHLSGKMRKFFIKILPGDKVKMEMSLYDLTKGRIVFRYSPTK